MLAPRTVIMAAALALAMLGRAGALHRAGLNETRWAGDESADPCECKNWRGVYTTRGGSMGVPTPCGYSNEYFFASGVHQPSPEHVGLLQGLWGAYCAEFFMRVNDNVCVNVNIGSEYGQWCYVDAACKTRPGSEHGGSITGNKVLKWKQCRPGHDRMLRDFSVADLVEFVKTHNVPFGVADHYAWPTFYHGHWHDVEEYFAPGRGNGTKVNWEMQEEVDSIVEYGKPVVFDQTPTYGPPHAIVEGSRRFSVVPRDRKDPGRHSLSTWSHVIEVLGKGRSRVLL